VCVGGVLCVFVLCGCVCRELCNGTNRKGGLKGGGLKD
jgi:hypothetical protein